MLRRIGRHYRAQWHALGSLSSSIPGLLLRFALSVIASAIAFGISTWLTPGVTDAGDPSVLGAVLLLGLIDVGLRPVLMAIALPIGLIAVGILGLLFRVVMFALVLPATGYAGHRVVHLRRGADRPQRAHRHVGRGQLLAAGRRAGHP